jgi:hypothetical protein
VRQAGKRINFSPFCCHQFFAPCFRLRSRENDSGGILGHADL